VDVYVGINYYVKGKEKRKIKIVEDIRCSEV